MEFGQKSVALVGRPNVGKSRLFNAIAGRRLSIVHDRPGVTRDVVSFALKSGHMLLDTGGIGIKPEMTPRSLHRATEQQVEFALQAADLVLLVADGLEGMTPLDEILAERLKSSGKPSWVVVNKIDGPEHEDKVHEFAGLGLREVVFTSAEHRRGISRLRQLMEEELGSASPEARQGWSGRIRISFVGRPNVGKSSLCNALLREERMIVSEIPGTTRDAVSQDLDYRNDAGDRLKFSLIDTAGLRRKAKVSDPIEFFSSLRVEDTIARSDVVFLVLDALDGVTRQDKLIARHILGKGKGIIVLVNKWDFAVRRFKEAPLPGHRDLEEFRQRFEQSVRKEISFLPDAPVLFVSALEGLRIDEIPARSSLIYKRLFTEIPTGRLNAALNKLMLRNPPRLIKKIRFKIYYAVQTSRRPIKLRLFCNNEGRLDETYRRFLQSNLIREFDLGGCPVLFDLVGKKPFKPYK